ncbi:hypothetical protein EPN87_02880 [archaeon]|nr:MAG: hypothetical protein EPN87_02880 [archaeon]
MNPLIAIIVLGVLVVAVLVAVFQFNLLNLAAPSKTSSSQATTDVTGAQNNISNSIANMSSTINNIQNALK